MKPSLTPITFLILCAALLLLTSRPALAQSERASEAIKESNSPQGVDCAPGKTFTFGSGANFFQFCLSDRGNIVDLFSPAGFRQIPSAEGYVACGTGAANAYDSAPSSSGWGPATTTSQPNGPDTLPVTIVRSSTDGKFQLTQTFEWDTARKDILITMVLKNTSAASITSAKLARYFEGVISGDFNDDIFDRDSDSAWGKDDGAGLGHHGLMLTALTFAQPHTTAVESFDDFRATTVNHTAKGCTPIPQAVPTAPGSFAGRVQYSLGTIPAGLSKTVKVLYRRF